MRTVHLIANAHLDPVWLWPWQAGVDAALNTMRSVCDVLDRHPDVVFTCGEAWKYGIVEQLDPALFARVVAQVKQNRWEIVGGWWIQPDCNFPTGFGMAQQIAQGRAYFQERFGTFPITAYNVDSFGHAAALPDLLHAAGQSQYIFMRPQEHERALPARLFRWRGRAGGPEVTAFRIAGAYNYNARWINTGNLEQALSDLPPGIEHTMCFVGVGDHGGGPTEDLIAWCREHEHALPDARLVFSSPRRFFAAIDSQRDRLPLVTGELQHHAIGCYSVHRPIKTLVRRAEHLAEQATLRAADDAAAAQRLTQAWRDICFASFHDTMGGTCLPSAYEQCHAQAGRALATADELLQFALRRKVVALPPDAQQRVVLWNPSDGPFEGYVTWEPWNEGQAWSSEWRLVDEAGEEVPWQYVQPEAAVRESSLRRVLFRVALAAGALRVLRVVFPSGPEPRRVKRLPQIDATLRGLANDRHAGVDFAQPHQPAKLTLPGLGADVELRLELLPDATDTWSHGVDRYPSGPAESPVWETAHVVETGPLRAAALQRGRVGESLLEAEYLIYDNECYVDVILRIDWRATHRVLKLTIPLDLWFDGQAISRVDGHMGVAVPRSLDGAERPFADYTLLGAAAADVPGQSDAVGIVTPDVFALDADAQRVRLTLLRSPLMAHHDPARAEAFARRTIADQGPHTFRLRFFGLRADEDATALLQRHALMMHRPLRLAETTYGMTR